MLVCDRCDKSVFLKKESVTTLDGGHTKIDNYEQATDWKWFASTGDLCPECAKEWRELLEQFKKKPPELRKKK